MNMSEFYSKFLFRYQTDTALRKISSIPITFLRKLSIVPSSYKVVQLISEFYWIESDCRIHFFFESKRVLEQRKRSISILPELWQFLKPTRAL